MSIREFQATAAAALNAAEMARQRFTAASLKLHVTRFHYPDPAPTEFSRMEAEKIRGEFDETARVYLIAQDQVRMALEAVDRAKQLARQRRERRAGR